MHEITKVTVKLPTAEVDRLKELAGRRGTTVTDALRSAILTELYLAKAQDRKAKVLVQEPDKTTQQLVFVNTLKQK